MGSIGSVSYTHLDVYKRQGLTRSEYLRYVARMVADDAENAKRGGVLLDGLSMRRLSRELVRKELRHDHISLRFGRLGRGDDVPPPDPLVALGDVDEALSKVCLLYTSRCV